VFYGGMNLYRSTDGGLNFTAVNDWTQYYTTPATVMHADVNFITSFADAGGGDECSSSAPTAVCTNPRTDWRRRTTSP
jgi:hypothetical protein